MVNTAVAMLKYLTWHAIILNPYWICEFWPISVNGKTLLFA